MPSSSSSNNNKTASPSNTGASSSATLLKTAATVAVAAVAGYACWDATHSVSSYATANNAAFFASPEEKARVEALYREYGTHEPTQQILTKLTKGNYNNGEHVSVMFRKRADAEDTSTANGNNGGDDNLLDRTDSRVVVKKARPGTVPVTQQQPPISFRANVDPLLTIPTASLIDVDRIRKSEAFKLMVYNGGQHLTGLGAHSFQQVFVYAFFLMYERRLGKKSAFYDWFKTLPASFAHEGGALYWPDHVAECLDELARAEFIALRTIVGTIMQGANICCDLPEDAIADATVCHKMSKYEDDEEKNSGEDAEEEAAIAKEEERNAAIRGGFKSAAAGGGGGLPLKGAFTDEEARWAVAVYIRFNYNDQAIIPGMNHFRRSNDFEGVYLQTSKTMVPADDDDTDPNVVTKSAGIDIMTPKNMKEGDEAVWNFVRGPGSSLVTLGDFDPNAVVTEVPFRIPETTPKSLIAKMCSEQRQQIVFMTGSGRPRDEVLQCFGAMLAYEKSHRKNVLNLRKREPAFMVDIYGNLTMVASRQLNSIINATRNEMCTLEDVPEPQQNAIMNYLRFAAKTYDKILNHLVEETERLAKVAGLPSRLSLKTAPKADAAEGGAEASAEKKN